MTYIDRYIAARTPTPLPAAPVVPDLILTVDGVETVMSPDLAGPAYVAAIAAGKVASLRPVNAPPVAPSRPSTPTAVSVAVTTIPCDDTACDLDRWADPDTDEPVNAPGVSSIALARVTQQEQWATAAGFKLQELVYKPGEVVNSTGRANFASFKRDLDAMGTINAAANTLRGWVAAEDRLDVAVNAQHLRVTDSDGYTFATGPMLGGNGEKMTANAFDQMGALCKYGRGTKYLQEDCDAEQRAYNVNRHLSGLKKERPVILRTRMEPIDVANPNKGMQRVAFAAVTPSYQKIDCDTILDAVAANGVLADTRVEMTYNGARMRATALNMPDTIVDLACGDVFKAGVRISTDDTGRGRIRVSAVLFRNRCLNLIIIDEAEVETMSRVHRGSLPLAEVVAEVVEAIKAAYAKIAPFLNSWGQARAYKVADPKAALAALVENRDLTLTGMRSGAQRDQLVAALLGAFDAEPGDSAADLANAITRAAHERTDLFSLDLREELEKQASSLILLPGQLLSAYAVA